MYRCMCIRIGSETPESVPGYRLEGYVYPDQSYFNFPSFCTKNHTRRVDMVGKNKMSFFMFSNLLKYSLCFYICSFLFLCTLYMFYDIEIVSFVLTLHSSLNRNITEKKKNNVFIDNRFGRQCSVTRTKSDATKPITYY